MFEDSRENLGEAAGAAFTSGRPGTCPRLTRPVLRWSDGAGPPILGIDAQCLHTTNRSEADECAVIRDRPVPKTAAPAKSVSERRTGNSDSVTLGLLPASLESPFYQKMAIP